MLSVLHRCQNALEEESHRQEQHVPSTEKKYFAHESAFVDEGVEIGEGTSNLAHLAYFEKDLVSGRTVRSVRMWWSVPTRRSGTE